VHTSDYKELLALLEEGCDPCASEAVALTSIAISLKRIADTLDTMHFDGLIVHQGDDWPTCNKANMGK